MKQKTQTLKLSLLFAGLTLLCSACGGPEKIPTLGPQLDQARVLNSELRAEWDSTNKTLSSTLKAVDGLPSLAIDASKLDVDLLRKALFECFNTPVGAGADSARSGAAIDGEPTPALPPCEGMDIDALTNIGKASGPEIDKLYREKLAQMAMVRVNLRQNLPALTKAMSERYIAAEKELEELETIATLQDKDARSEDISEADRTKFRSEFDALKKELAAIKALISETKEAPAEIDTSVRTAIDELLSNLAKMGN
jgi:hypothetical protein